MTVTAGGFWLDRLAALSDPRQVWKVVYPLPEVSLLVLCGTLASPSAKLPAASQTDRCAMAETSWKSIAGAC